MTKEGQPAFNRPRRLFGDPNFDFGDTMFLVMAEEKKKTRISRKCKQISIKLPEFINKDPELWLIQVHSQFVLANVIKEELQYHYIVSSLPQEATINVRDVIKANVQIKLLDTFKRCVD